MRRYFDSSLRFAGWGFCALVLLLMSCMIVIWWFNVLRFFFFAHWRPTLCVVIVFAAWYAIAQCITAVSNRCRTIREARGYLDYGDDYDG